MDSCTRPSNIVVIGTSAGGFLAATKLLSALGEDLNAAVFIVIHISKNSLAPVIANHLQKQTKLRIKVAEDGEPICNKMIYLAPSDHHLMIDQNSVVVQRGAYENHYRPSIDVLFRSAAASYGSCVTGIVLTGMLDDGTSGMSAIKRSGGLCIVQDPAEAEYPNMPNSVLGNLQVDYTLPVAEIGYVLTDLLANRACTPSEIPEDVRYEATITRRMSSEISATEPLGNESLFTCPDCGGILRMIYKDAVVRYRCYTGHTFTEASLVENQVRKLEESLWTAIRMMEERKNLLLTMRHEQGPPPERALQMEVHVQRLKEMLQQIGNTDSDLLETSKYNTP
jgi:two-component system chemotaxis response regulator CheB